MDQPNPIGPPKRASDPGATISGSMSAANMHPGAAAGLVGATRTGPFITASGRVGQALNWFFADKGRIFWALQVVGWAGFLALHLLSVSPLVGGRTPNALGT